jgi:hypothetical protein
VWSGSGDLDSSGVFGQRYDNAGAQVGGEFQINSYTTATQRDPAIGLDSAGNFVVVWESDGQDGDLGAIRGQRFDSAGLSIGSEFQVNTYTTGRQQSAAISVSGGGDFQVVWMGGGAQDGANSGIFGQRYDGSGAAQGGEFQVNTYTTNYQSYPAVAVDPAGNFTVVWAGYHQPEDVSGTAVLGQRYDSSGTELDGEFLINTFTPNGQARGVISAGPTDTFVVSWTSAAQDEGVFEGIYAQRFAFVPTTTTSSSTSTTLPTTDLLPGVIGIVKPGVLAKFVAKPTTGDTFTLPFGDPRIVGGSLRIYDSTLTAGDDTYALPAGGTPPLGWKGLGNPSGSSGYKYKGTGSVGDPCKVILVKSTVIKAVCKGSGINLSPPFGGRMSIELGVGTSDRYCAEFHGTNVKNDATIIKRKSAPAPAACRLVAFPACATPAAACGGCGNGFCSPHSDTEPPAKMCADLSACSALFCSSDGECPGGQACVLNPFNFEGHCCSPCP